MERRMAKKGDGGGKKCQRGGTGDITRTNYKDPEIQRGSDTMRVKERHDVDIDRFNKWL